MSFITKRERVFNEYDLFDLPARNEGKLKAYTSCTDARAWSHFCSDKSEHLVEIIKRNNETVRPKYIPTDVIVNTLMTAKNAEIGRLKRKIEEFEQMLSAYDQLDLTCDQKCDIANAHAAIKAANKELDEMCLDLDLSGFTEGMDSEAFETGKSRGDELSKYGSIETGKSGGGEIKAQEEWTFDKQKESTPRKEAKSVQVGPPCTCDASTSAHDPQVDEMQETIISKDAKLSAMQNTIAVMEHDVCEPYCIYAHIYTALEKIFGTLCQNGKYKQYLDLLTAGKDTRGIDIKGKILFKMKVLEKFSLALIAPCSQEFSRASKDCSCFRTEVVTTFALTSAESQIPNLDNKRAQLVADIMDNQEMKEILSKESLCIKIEEDQFDECFSADNRCIDVENLNRLKNLQANYDELLTCYDNLKHERDCLYLRCQKVAELENECECLKNSLREYNILWKEKEYHRKRSEDLDILKENYFVLSEETSNIETKFKAEQEINRVKSETVDLLRKDNMKLEQKLGDTSIQFEKQKNVFICKLKEYECKIMCQDQQIKSLSDQIDKLLEQEKNTVQSNEDALRTVQLIDEIESQKEQIKNLKDDLCCSEEEKLYLQEEFEKKLELINELKYDVEDWKSRCEEAFNSCNYLQLQIDELQNKNSIMNQELENKTNAIENLNDILCGKSREISTLIEEVDHKRDENVDLIKQMEISRESFTKNIASLMNEKRIAINSIIAAKRESKEMLKQFKTNDVTNEVSQITKNELETHINVNDRKSEKADGNSGNSLLTKEIELLNEANLDNINILQLENTELKHSYDVAKKESQILQQKLNNNDKLLEQYEKLKQSHERLLNEKERLQFKLNRSKNELDSLLQDYQVTKSKSESLINQSKDTKEQYANLNDMYEEAVHERNILHKIISDKNSEIKSLIHSLQLLKSDNERFNLKLQEIPALEKSLTEIQNKYEKLLSEKSVLQIDYDTKTREMINLHTDLENKIEENQRLQNHIKIQKSWELSISSSMSALRNENNNMNLNLDAARKDSAKLLDKIKHYESIEDQNKELQLLHKKIQLENENLRKDLSNLKKLHEEQQEYLESIEKALVHSREENISKACSVSDLYADLKKEVEKLKDERFMKHTELKTLMEKLDASECIIADLNEEILARDKRISILENHINELQVEIKANQNNLVEVVKSGELLQELSYEKLNQCVKQIEAHQSKATHNMKIELARLQNEKENLEDQLSTTKSFTEETLKEKNQYIALITQLQNEKQKIITDIQRLEISCIGQSNLVPNECSLSEVIASLDRIGQYINSKNNYLEKTYLNVQASYQLLKSKADEAKDIAEKEQQKILFEKEQTKKERIEIEKQLDNVKAKMKEDKINYERVIKDLEGEILNQKLIFDSIKQSKEDHILKLIEKNNQLLVNTDSYDIEIKELKQQLQNACEQKSKNLSMFENTKTTLDKQESLVKELQKQIEVIKNKPSQQVGVQTFAVTKDNICQTDYEYSAPNSLLSGNNKYEDVKVLKRNVDKYPISDMVNEKDSPKNHQILDVNPIDRPINEVQILTANIEPKIDFVRNIYLKYKINRLGPGRLEQHSIASLTEDIKVRNIDGQDLNVSDNIISEIKFPESLPSTNLNYNRNSDSIIDIYNTQISTNSTKITEEANDNITDISNKEDNSILSESRNQHLHNANTSHTKVFIQDSSFKDSYQSTENDLFLIYKDSDSIYDEHKVNKLTNLNSTNANQKIDPKNTRYLNALEPINTRENISNDRDDGSLKPKLEINMPRVIRESHSVLINSDEDKKSLDSFSNATYVSPHTDHTKTNKPLKDFEFNLNSATTPLKSQINQIYREKISKENNFSNRSEHDVHSNRAEENSIKKQKSLFKDSDHKLSRVGATVVVLQSTTNDSRDEPLEDFNINSNYGLQYILNTVQNEINPNKTKNFNIIGSVQKSHSEEQFNFKSESSQSQQLSPLKFSSFEYKTESNISPLHSNSTERGTLVKMDDIQDYENKIQKLTKTLEHVEKQYKQKIEFVKEQYDYNVRSIINEHNHGVKGIQNLHEEKLRDIMIIHENEVETLRTMSNDAMCVAEKLQIENRSLKSKLSKDTTIDLNEEPIKMHSASDSKKRKCRCRVNGRNLTKTNVEAFNVRPRRRSHGPCTCSLDMSISDTIRNIFDQLDVDQRKMAEQAYLKYIANKIVEGNVETLDSEELSFLHLKVCRTWKTRVSKEDALQMKIDSLETEVTNRQRQQQIHMAEIDRKVAEELRRLQEVREAVCFSPKESPESSRNSPTPLAIGAAEKDVNNVRERQSEGDLASRLTETVTTSWKRKRVKMESNKAVLAKLDNNECHRDRGPVSDETPTRLKRAQDRHYTRIHKK